jgi:hypothetical protein
MRLTLDWILKEPIDREYKEYVLLDYISKIENDIDNFIIYPTLQELSLHLANSNSIKENLTYIDLKREPEEIDDEILVSDLEFKNITISDKNDGKEIVKIAKMTHDTLKDFFLITKSIWSIIFESILIELDEDSAQITEKNYKNGIITFKYKDEYYVYEYKIKKLDRTSNEEKCMFKLKHKTLEPVRKPKNKVIFKAQLTQNFPLEGSLLSIVKRKIINYIRQTINISKIKQSQNEKREKIS